VSINPISISYIHITLALCFSVSFAQGNSPVVTTVTDVNSKTTITLDTQLSAGGISHRASDSSMVCALLKRCSIILLDGMTSSIDFDTDTKFRL